MQGSFLENLNKEEPRGLVFFNYQDVLVRLAVALGNDNNGHDKSEDQLSSHLFGLEVD